VAKEQAKDEWLQPQILGKLTKMTNTCREHQHSVNISIDSEIMTKGV
jgi:hypothetical protein